MTLSAANVASPTFTSPSLPQRTSATLVFALVVSDAYGGVSGTSTVTLRVDDVCHVTGDDTDCDGLDDDCDGVDDNHYVIDTSCFRQGVCAAGNVASSCAAGGAETLCATGAPSGVAESVCNGLDDDCDGAVDEAYLPDTSCFRAGACAAGNVASTCLAGVVTACQTGIAAASDATCDGVDDDCDGTPDEDFVGVATSCGLGVCEAHGVTTCVGGHVEDSCREGAPRDDDDCDGLDDDCDGTPDDDFIGAPTTCGVGACAAVGVTACVAAQVIDTCVEGESHPDTNCDGVDDDCDGTADDGYIAVETTCGEGACAAVGVTSCVGATVLDSCTPILPGVCGCGVPDVDSDGDLTLDCLDACPTDPGKVEAGECGCGVADRDIDQDGIIDCNDQCVAGSQSCAPVPFFLTVKVGGQRMQVACTWNGSAIACDQSNGSANLSPITEETSCE